MTRARSFRLLAAAALAAAAGACERLPSDGGDLATAERAARSITPERVAAHVAYLAADALRGRRTPSPELNAAAAYIAGSLRAAGVAGGAESPDGFLQRYPCTGVPDGAWPANVVGVLPGSDRARRAEWVVVSAHYDHLGVGKPDARGDSIYNGADDNASGTAALLEVARTFALLPRRPARSVAFVAVSGEEEGLIGSSWFVAHPPAAIAHIVADINLDMLGRNAPDLIYLVGDSLSTLGSVARVRAATHGELRFMPRPGPAAEQLFFRSDQFAFAAARVPALFLNTGSHVDLHRLSDEAVTLDEDKVARAARLAFFMAHALASAPDRPTWTPAGERLLPNFRPYSANCVSPAGR